jgi:hypothetical protein
MFKKSGLWTDPQGAEHTDATFKISQCDMATNKQSRLATGGGYQEAESVNNTDTSLSYQVLYWTNEAAMLNGLPPYPLLNVSTLASSDSMGQEEKIWFRNYNVGEAYTSLSAEQAAEQHCLDVVLA